MKKLLLLFSLLSIFSILALGQPAPPSPSQYNFFTPAPTSPTPFTVVTNGSGSGRTFYYFIVTHYSSGNAVSPNPGGVAYSVAPTLSGTSYVTITWNPQPNATGYDVIRLLTSNFISTCVNCLVVSNTGSNSVVDNTNSLSGYTLTNAIQPATGSISLNQFGQFNFNPSTTNLPTGSIANTTAILKGNGSGGAVAALAADIVALFSTCSGIQYLGADGACHNASSGSGTVTTFSAGNLSPLFTTSVATPTSTPALSFSLTNALQNLFFASPNGSTGPGNYRAIVVADLPGSIPNSKLANPATTVNGQTCTLGSICTVTAVPSGSAGGDLGGTYPNPSVTGLNTVPFCTGFTPTNNQFLQYTTGGSPNPCYTAATSTSGGTTNQNIRQLGVHYDGGGTALSGTQTTCVLVTYAGAITGWYMDADIAGSGTIAIRSVALSSYTGVAGFGGYTDVINGGTAPILSSATNATFANLTSWITTVTPNIMYCIQLTSPATATVIDIFLTVAAN